MSIKIKKKKLDNFKSVKVRVKRKTKGAAACMLT